MQKIVTSERPHLRCTVLYGRHGGVCAPKSGHVIGSTVSVTKVEVLFTFFKTASCFPPQLGSSAARCTKGNRALFVIELDSKRVMEVHHESCEGYTIYIKKEAVKECILPVSSQQMSTLVLESSPIT